MPLLSHIMFGRNDNYLGNFKRRLEMSVNYNSRQAAECGHLGDYEILICDWDSPRPLRLDLNLDGPARQCTRFLEIDRDMIIGGGLDPAVFNLAAAMNVGLRRAGGEMLMLSPAEVFFPHQAMKNLFALIKNEVSFPADIRNCYLGALRYMVPWQIAEHLGPDDLDRYFLLHCANLRPGHYFPDGSHCHGLAAGEGAHLFSRELARKIKGASEEYIHRSQDLDLGRRIGQLAPVLKADLAGVFCYDLDQRPRQRASLRVNEDKVYPTLSPNGDNWGLAAADIPFRAAEPLAGAGRIEEEAPRPYEAESLLEKRPPERSGLLKAARLLSARLGGRDPQDKARRLFRLAGPRGKRDIFRRLGFETLLEGLRRGDIPEFEMESDPPASGRAFWGDWFGPQPALYEYLTLALDKKAGNFISNWSLQQAYGLLAVLATVGRRRPRRFYCTPLRDFYLIQAAAAVDPTIEITAYDHWRTDLFPRAHAGGRLYPIDNLSPILESVDYIGYLHVQTGPLENAFERLREIPFAGDPFQVMYLDLDFLEAVTNGLYDRLAPLTGLGCALICRGRPDLRKIWRQIMADQAFTLVGALPGLDIFTVIAEPAAKGGEIL